MEMHCFHLLARERKKLQVRKQCTLGWGNSAHLDEATVHAWMEYSRDRKQCAVSTNDCEERVTTQEVSTGEKRHRGRSSNAVNNHAGALQHDVFFIQPGPAALQLNDPRCSRPLL